MVQPEGLVLESLAFQRTSNDQTLSFDFSVTLAKGERLAVMGPSGCGKSTLLDLIAGFETPSRGTLRYDGQDLIPLPVAARPVTLLSQSDNLFPHLSAFANTALGLTTKRKLTAEQTQDVNTVLAEVGLDGMGQRLPGAMSGGQQQRCALARSLLRNRPLLLLDEPFSALDQDLRGEMVSLVNQLVAKRNLSLITVTHDRGDAELMSDRILGISDGQLVP